MSLPGLLVTGLVWTFVNVDKADLSVLKGFDLAGLLFMALFLGTLEFVVEEGPRNDWFEDHAIAIGAAVCAVSAVLFFWRVLTYHNPIVGTARLQGPQFRDRLPVQLRDRRRAVWVRLYNAAVPGTDPGAEQPSDRHGDVRHRHVPVHVGAGRRHDCRRSWICA